MRRAAVIASLAVAFLAGCPHPPTQTTPPGGGSAVGVGSGSGSGSDQTQTKPPRVDVKWDSAGVAWDQLPEPGPEPSYTPPAAIDFKLKNGIRVLLIENHRLPLVSIRVVNTRGGAREDGKATGLASLTADLLDEGAGTLDSLALPEELEKLGAELDVSVGSDYAIASLDTLAETLEPSLGVLADVLIRPQLTDADFTRIKGDTLEDIKRRTDSPMRIAGLVFDQTIFGAHPYGAPTEGMTATVDKIALADVKAFWKSRYTPSTATVIVAGDVDRDKIEPMLATTFGVWKGKKPPAAKKAKAPAATKPRIVIVDKPGAEQAVVDIGRLGPASTDPDYFPAAVYNTALGGSFASRLNHRIREELGYTYGISSGYWRGAWVGSWSVSSALETKTCVAGIKEALAIIERTRNDGLGAEELAKAKQLMIRGLPQDFETNAAIARIYSTVITQGRPLDWVMHFADNVRDVDGDAARKLVAGQWSGLAIVVVGDWKVLGPGLAELGLPITHVDADGNPVK